MEGVMVPFSSIGVRELVRATLVLAIEPFAVVICLLWLSSRWLQKGFQKLVDIIWGCLSLDFVLLLESGWLVGIRVGRLGTLGCGIWGRWALAVPHGQAVFFALFWQSLVKFLTKILLWSLSWDVSVHIENFSDNLFRLYILSILFRFLDWLVLDWALGRGTLLGGYRCLCFGHESLCYKVYCLYFLLKSSWYWSKISRKKMD